MKPNGQTNMKFEDIKIGECFKFSNPKNWKDTVWKKMTSEGFAMYTSQNPFKYGGSVAWFGDPTNQEFEVVDNESIKLSEITNFIEESVSFVKSKAEEL